MDSNSSSATASVDPDRLTIEHFEQGGAHPQTEDIVIIKMDPKNNKSATFSIRNEDHTLGNALRHTIMQNPEVDFCGYTIPHPSEAKIHIRIQSRASPAIDVLRKGFDDLEATMRDILQKFELSLENDKYEHHPDLEI